MSKKSQYLVTECGHLPEKPLTITEGKVICPIHHKPEDFTIVTGSKILKHILKYKG